MDACEKYEFIYVKPTNKIIIIKMCKNIYGHGQCNICVTLKLQVTSHFLQSLEGLVCSCSIVQLCLVVLPLFLVYFGQLVAHVHVGQVALSENLDSTNLEGNPKCKKNKMCHIKGVEKGRTWQKKRHYF